MAEDTQASRSPTDNPPNEIAQIPAEILARLPESDRQRVLEFFSASMVAQPASNPLLAKVSPQHITDMIALASKSGDLALEDRKHSRKFSVITLGLVVLAALVLLLVLALRGQDNLILEVIKLFAIGIGGFGGGYGFARWRGGSGE